MEVANDIAEVLAWMACVFTAALALPTVAALLYALWRKGDAAKMAVPAAVVQMAPFGVAYAAYVTGKLPGSHDRAGGVTLALVSGNFVSTAVIMLFAPYLWRMPFAPTWSALTFPLVSSANGVLIYLTLPGHPPEHRRVFDIVAAVYLALASAIVLMVWTRLFFFLVTADKDGLPMTAVSYGNSPCEVPLSPGSTARGESVSPSYGALASSALSVQVEPSLGQPARLSVV
jgi:tellurite resistance protein TehA-like permease